MVGLLLVLLALTGVIWSQDTSHMPVRPKRWEPARAQNSATVEDSVRPTPPLPSPIPLAVEIDPIADPGLIIDEQGTREALQYVSERFGNGPSTGFHAVYVTEPNCFLNGIAHTVERTVQVNTCNSIGTDRAIVIMAHEFVHQLAQDRYGPAHLSADLILAEGVATWGAGRYWLGGTPNFRTWVRGVGIQYPLTESYVDASGRNPSIKAMNTKYYQWASFVEFLIETYGRAKFDQVYVTGSGLPGTSDYQGVYGKDMPTLEQAWTQWIQS